MSDNSETGSANLFPQLAMENMPVQINKPFSKQALSLGPAHTVPEIPLA